MKALLAAGGRSTRMRPITHTINKHLIPLAGRPMLAYPIMKLVEAGITDIVVNVNPGETEMMHDAFGDGSAYGATLTYLEQEGGPKGLAHVVANAEKHLRGPAPDGAGRSPFVFFLGDNVMAGSIRKLKERYEAESLDCMLALARVHDPHRFGVPEFNAEGILIRAVEKPAQPPSPFAITGVYFFNDRYFDAFRTMKPSARGEYEITDMISWYITNGRVGTEEVTGWWKDTGTPDALLEGNALMLDELQIEKTPSGGTRVDASSRVQGNVRIGAGSQIGPNVLIRGPVSIGERCLVRDCYIGPYTSIGNGVELRNTEIEHSIVFDGAKIDCGKRIVDSIIGKNVIVSSTQGTLPRGHKLIVGDQTVIEL